MISITTLEDKLNKKQQDKTLNPTLEDRGSDGDMKILAPSLVQLAANLRQTVSNIQTSAFYHGKSLNEIGKQLDPNFEPVIIGQQHRAAGILPFIFIDDKCYVLGGMFTKNGDKLKFGILGGKAQGTESPIDTALREFNEETLSFLGKDFDKRFRARPQFSYSIVSGKYTLYLVELDRFLKVEAKSLLDVSKYDKILSELPERQKMISSGAVPAKLVWQDLVANDIVLNDFAKTVLTDPGVRGFLME